MSRIQLFIATTLDGFIAREDGSLDWLLQLSNPSGTDHGYNEFIGKISTIVMGRKTYEKVLGFGIDWPYTNCRTLVVTKNESFSVSTSHTSVVHEINKESIEEVKAKAESNIWLVGGGEIITRFLDLSEIDEMILCMIPIILGKGIKLFPNEPAETHFEFVRSEAFDTGVVNLTYLRKKYPVAG